MFIGISSHVASGSTAKACSTIDRSVDRISRGETHVETGGETEESTDDEASEAKVNEAEAVVVHFCENEMK